MSATRKIAQLLLTRAPLNTEAVNAPGTIRANREAIKQLGEMNPEKIDTLVVGVRHEDADGVMRYHEFVVGTPDFALTSATAIAEGIIEETQRHVSQHEVLDALETALAGFGAVADSATTTVERDLRETADDNADDNAGAVDASANDATPAEGFEGFRAGDYGGTSNGNTRGID